MDDGGEAMTPEIRISIPHEHSDRRDEIVDQFRTDMEQAGFEIGSSTQSSKHSKGLVVDAMWFTAAALGEISLQELAKTIFQKAVPQIEKHPGISISIHHDSSSTGITIDGKSIKVKPEERIVTELEGELTDTAKSSRRALLIGVDAHPENSDFDTLHYVKNDIREFAHVLKNPDIGGFSDIWIAGEAVPDGKGGTEYFPKTRTGLEDLISQFYVMSRPGDLSLIYFSGHGVAGPDDSYYLGTEELSRKDLARTGLEIAAITLRATQRAGRSTVLIIDACFSGGAIERLNTRGNIDGLTVLTAALPAEVAKEDPNLEMGVFTYHLCKGLVTGDATNSNSAKEDITIRDIHRYLERALEGSKQNPCLWPDTPSEGYPVIGKNRWPRQIADVRSTIDETARHELLDEGTRELWGGFLNQFENNISIENADDMARFDILHSFSAGALLLSEAVLQWQELAFAPERKELTDLKSSVAELERNFEEKLSAERSHKSELEKDLAQLTKGFDSAVKEKVDRSKSDLAAKLNEEFEDRLNREIEKSKADHERNLKAKNSQIEEKNSQIEELKKELSDSKKEKPLSDFIAFVVPRTARAWMAAVVFCIVGLGATMAAIRNDVMPITPRELVSKYDAPGFLSQLTEWYEKEIEGHKEVIDEFKQGNAQLVSQHKAEVARLNEPPETPMSLVDHYGAPTELERLPIWLDEQRKIWDKELLTKIGVPSVVDDKELQLVEQEKIARVGLTFAAATRCDALAGDNVDPNAKHIAVTNADLKSLSDVERNIAIRSCRKAFADTQDTRYRYQMARAHIGKDNDVALHELELAASELYSAALTLKGLAYRDGSVDGIPLVDRDRKVAAAAYNLAIKEKQNPVAMYQLATMYRLTKRNTNEVDDLVRRAAEGGFVLAMRKFGEKLLDGSEWLLGSTQCRNGINWLAKAAKAGDETAVDMLQARTNQAAACR